MESTRYEYLHKNNNQTKQIHKGLIGIISAFNFPTAVFAWNFCVAAVCGNLSMWKDAPSTPLCGIACTKIILEVLEKNNLPKAVLTLCIGGRDIGETLV